MTLAEAEHRLRAGGLTGARAFDALVAGLRARLGDPVEVHPLAAAVLADVPLTGDLLDLAWERFFPDVLKAAHGQYFTPPPVARLLVALAGIRPADDVLDPTCGAGGLLRAAHALGARVRGIERDPGLAALARVQLRIAGAPPEIETRDWFAGPTRPADVVVANPPFSVWIDDPEVLARFGREERASSEDLFVASLGAAVRPGGRAAVVLPWSVLHNPRRRAVRRALDAAFATTEVVELPEGVFRPFGGAGGRAVVLGLTRRPCAAPEARTARVSDPGYDVRSVYLKRTTSVEIDRLIAGDGWTVPSASRPDGTVPVGALARLVPAKGAAKGAPRVDLGDVDRATGEIAPRPGPTRRRRSLRAGEVWVARLRPELGIVGWAPDAPEPLAGSPEFVALDAGDDAGFLAAALRSPAWRARLPSTTGQTRPRTTPDDVLATPVRPPAGLGARWTAVSARLLAARARARDGLAALQAAMDAFQAGTLDAEGLAGALAAVERDADR